MNKNNQKAKEEKDLLKESCQKEPRDLELIAELLKVHKSKTLLNRKRGLLNEIDNKLNDFILKSRTKNNG